MRLVLICLLLYLCFPFLALAIDPNLPGAKFEAARQALREENFEAAAQSFKELKDLPALSEWATVFLAEAYFAKSEINAANRELSSVLPDSAASLYAKALELEIELHEQGQLNTKDLFNLKNRVAAIGSSLPKAKLEYLSIMIAEGSAIEKIKGFQEFRSQFSRSIEAKRLLKIQNQLYGTDLKLWSDAALLLEELKVLERQGFAEQAFFLGVDFIKNNPLPKSKEDRRELFTTLDKIAPTLKPTQSLESITAGLDKDAAIDIQFVRSLAIARGYWNKSFYSEALRSLNALSPDEPDRIYLEARIREEQGLFEEAITKYREYLSLNDQSNRSEAGRRLFFLLILTQEDSEARSLSPALIKAATSDEELRDSIVYWGAGSREKLTPNSYYYWLSQGFTSEHPEADNLNRKSGTECDPPILKISDDSHKVFMALQSFGLLELLTEEFSFRVPVGRDVMSTLSRAQLLSAYGATQGTIAELSSNLKYRTKIFADCNVNVARILYPLRYVTDLQARSAELSIPISLLLGLMRTESSFNSLAISSTGARGLMQLMEATAQQEGFSGNSDFLFSPSTNIFYGSKHLSGLIKEYEGQWYLALGAYNAGKAAVERWRGRYPNVKPALWIELIPFDETRRYIKRVLSAYWTYSERLK